MTGKDISIPGLPTSAPRLTDWQKKKVEEQARLALLRAAIASWAPLSAQHEAEMQECRERLAEGGAARDRAAEMQAENRARMPQKAGDE